MHAMPRERCFLLDLNRDQHEHVVFLQLFGCGFSTIALGDGVIDIKGVCEVLKDADIPSSTLEIIGSEDILKKSVKYLKDNGL